MDHFHHLVPAEWELASLQVDLKVKHLRDTVGKRVRCLLNGVGPTYLGKLTRKKLVHSSCHKWLRLKITNVLFTNKVGHG